MLIVQPTATLRLQPLQHKMLTTLPPELVFLIADEFGKCRKDVYAFAACHRHLYDILIPRLFSKVRIPVDISNRNKVHFRDFLYAIHKNPKIINAMRSLTVKYPYAPCLPPIDESLSNLNSEVIQSSLTTFPEEEREKWKVAAQKRTPSVWLALLLLRLKNLQTIVLDGPPTHIMPFRKFVGFALMQAASTPIWPYLESATISFLGSEWAPRKNEMSLMALFLSIPSIRSLTTFHMGERQVRYSRQLDALTRQPRLIPLPESSNVTELRLFSHQLEPDDLANLIKSCQCLRTFKCSNFPLYSLTPGVNSRFKLQDLLQCHKTVLETLRVRRGPIDYEYYPDLREHPRSFAAFTALKSLYIRLSDLLALELWPEQDPPDPVYQFKQGLRDILPPSLKTLWLYCSDTGKFGLAIGKLGELMSQTSGLSLTQLTLHGSVAAFEGYFQYSRPSSEWSDVHRNLERLDLLCQERGITLDIRDWCDPAELDDADEFYDADELEDADELDEAEETDNSSSSEVSDNSDNSDSSDDADDSDLADDADGSRDPTYRDCSENEDDTEDEDDMDKEDGWSEQDEINEEDYPGSGLTEAWWMGP